MKKQIIASALMSAVMLTGISVDRSWSFSGPHDGGPNVSVERRVERMTQVLGLSDAQKQQITTLLQAERAKNAPLHEQLVANRKQLKQATLAAAFDETAVQNLAASQAQIISQMIVSRARTKSQINALLTPEQRTMAEKMRAMKKHPHRGPGGPEGGF